VTVSDALPRSSRRNTIVTPSRVTAIFSSRPNCPVTTSLFGTSISIPVAFFAAVSSFNRLSAAA
jgi:hypothetical protein